MSNYFTASDSMQSILEVDTDDVTPTKTKIACTLGPKSREVGVLEELLESGMQIARIDTSWGTPDYHQVTANNLRRAMNHTKFLCALMIDTRGSDIKVLNRSGDPPVGIQIEAGSKVMITTNTELDATSTCLPISCRSLEDYDLQPGSGVFVGEYLFSGSEENSVDFVIEEVTEDNLICVASNSAILKGVRLAVHFHGGSGTAPIMAPEDIEIISSFGVKNKIDFLNLSYCKSAKDVSDCRALLDSVGLISTKILAKIETREGLDKLLEIVREADGVILSRGQLGVDIPAEKMFRVQKNLLKLCNQLIKPIVVTRVVDSMTSNPRPTRAEATDVANLVLDGADCIMLGAETFGGDYPVGSVKIVSRIARRAEMSFDSGEYYQSLVDDSVGEAGEWTGSKTEALASSAVRAAAKLNAALIIAFTITGNTARTISKYRPPMPVLTVVFPRLRTDGLKWTYTGDAVARQVLLSRGVTALLADPNMGGTEDYALEGSMLNRAIAYAYKKKWVKLGDRVVVSQCPKTHSAEVSFDEQGLVKIVVLTKDLLEAAIAMYNTHSMSISSRQVQSMFKFLPQAASFKGRPINMLPSLISFKSTSTVQNDDEDGDDDDNNFADKKYPGMESIVEQVSDISFEERMRNLGSHRVVNDDEGHPRRNPLKWIGNVSRIWGK